MPLQPEQLFKEALFRITGIPSAEQLCFRPVGGGSINVAYQVSTKDNNHWFCKFNDTRKFPDLFLILQWIGEGSRTPGFWPLCLPGPCHPQKYLSPANG
jgi:hypothetical protein